MKQPRRIAIDTETVNLKPYGGVLWMLSVTEGTKTRVFHNCNGLALKGIPKDVQRDLADDTVEKVMHSGQHDCPYIELNWGIKIRNVWDTELCETVVQGMRVTTQLKNIPPGSHVDKMMRAHSTQLKYVLPRYKFKEPDKDTRLEFINRPKGIPFSRKAIDYAAGDTKDLLKIAKYQEALLLRDGQMEVALLENKVSERYHDMKVRGIGFDVKIWRELAEKYTIEFKARMAKLPNAVENWNSPAQVKKYFYNLGIKIDSYDELDEVYLATRNKTLGDFILARELHKAVTSYGLSWFGGEYINFKGEKVKGESYVDADGRIRCSVTQIINSGRNSMSDPNLQQLPGKGNVDYIHKIVMLMILKQQGKNKTKWEHRKAFIPKKGHVFVIGDFGGQEMGVMAAMSDEQLWIDAMLRGDDPHALTASLINPTTWNAARAKGCTFPKKCSCPGHLELREPAKINNFMLAYGGGAGKFAKSTGTERLAAIMYVAAHKRVTPRLTATLERNGRDAIATGVSYSADPYRRRRVLRGEEEWQVRNQGKNNPIQSAGANMLKLAMVSLPWKFPIVLVIHDEIICEVPIADAKECLKALKQVMEKSADYITGIKGLIKAEPKYSFSLMKEEEWVFKGNKLIQK